MRKIIPLEPYREMKILEKAQIFNAKISNIFAKAMAEQLDKEIMESYNKFWNGKN
jgi:hypothetical protein